MAERSCSSEGCCGGSSRREFLRSAAITLGVAPFVAGPFTAEAEGPSSGAQTFIPADKKLSPQWVRSLFEKGERKVYRGKELATIGMPIGGIAAGQVYLTGDGRLAHFDIFNRTPDTGSGEKNYVFRTPVFPLAQAFTISAGGAVRTLDREGFPDVSFVGEYPLGFVTYEDAGFPLVTMMEAYSPFVPLNASDSALPATILSFTVENRSDQAQQILLSGHLENAVLIHSKDSHAGKRVNQVRSGAGLTFLECSVVAPEPAEARPTAPPEVFADFEGSDYGNWKVEGTAFGSGPARGTLPNQQRVSGFRGKGLVNSFTGGDDATGKLTSPPFTIQRPYITFLIGGGSTPGKTCMNLVVDGGVVRTATGRNNERLDPASWNVRNLIGKTAHIEIVDDATGGWGHINVDQIVFTDRRPVGVVKRATRELHAEKPYLLFPVHNGAAKRKVTVSVAGRAERQFEIELADGDAEWWAPLDISAWHGQKLSIEVDQVPGDSQALASLKQSDKAVSKDDLYRERLRPQLHFSPRRGWLNDPNGLVFYQGRYHVFFQHNPYGWSWGNMHWGHAIGSDLIHWQEGGEALYPDSMGPMFSGSAVVDWHNTSGLGRDGKPPLVLFYTAAGNPTVQCLAYSNDGGKSFTKYEQNPIVKQITPGNRDPKVIWHEPSRRWVMVLYAELPEKKQEIQFLTSPDLKEWTATSQSDGFFECPDLFELPVDGDASYKKWVLTAASSEYQVGTFGGERFVPETPKLPGHRGRGFYAAQTFSDIPAGDGRRIQIGWLQAASPGMSFNQCLSVPLKLNLVTTPDGPRLTWSPVAELEQLRRMGHRLTNLAMKSGDSRSIDGLQSELLDIVAVIEPTPTSKVAFDVRGVPIRYDAVKQELEVNGHRAAAPLRDGKLDLRILVDRTVFEVFANGGLTYVPMPVIPEAANRTLSVAARDGDARLPILEVYELRSIWR